MLRNRGILGRIYEIFHSLRAIKRISKQPATPSFFLLYLRLSVLCRYDRNATQ